MGILTISRQLGSLGDEIAEVLKENLNYQLFNKNSIEKELQNHGIYDFDKKIEKYDEKRPALRDALSSDRIKYLHFLKSAVLEHAKAGNSVILGRGSQEILRNIPGVLHLRLIADPETRITRIKEKFACNKTTAQKIIDHSDQEREGFHWYFFNCNWSSHENYDLIINTKKYIKEDCIKIIQEAMQPLENKKNVAALNDKLNDLIISEKVFKKILYEDVLPIWMLDVKTEEGIVTLNGTVSIEENIEYCKIAAEKIENVKKVKSEITFVMDNRTRLT